MKTINMKQNQKRAIALLALAATAALSGCGRSGSAPIAGDASGAGAGVPGFGGGCMPLQQMVFPFTALNANYQPRMITMGTLPGTGLMGQVQMGGAAMPGPFRGVVKGVSYFGTQFGTVNLNIAVPMGTQGAISPYNYQYQNQFPNQYPNQYPVQQIPGIQPGYYPIQPSQLSYINQAMPVSISGVLQINQNTVMDIQNQVMMGQIQLGINTQPMPMPMTYSGGMNTNPMFYQQPMFNPASLQQICVSQVAIKTNITLDGSLYIGDIYLYLNNTQHGMRYILQTN